MDPEEGMRIHMDLGLEEEVRIHMDLDLEEGARIHMDLHIETENLEVTLHHDHDQLQVQQSSPV